MLDTIVFDVDGTLVDSSYRQLIAWSRAFAAVGVVVAGWRLHRCLGMGGDQLVGAVAGAGVERAVGEEVRERWRSGYDELLGEVRPFPEAVATLEAFRRAGLQVVLASSGERDHLDRSLQILDLGRGDFPLVSSADVDRTMPAPDLIGRAVAVAGGTRAALVGDTVWDVRAGRRAGVPVLGVLTGGIGPTPLRRAGAARVFDDVAALGCYLPSVVTLLGDEVLQGRG